MNAKNIEKANLLPNLSTENGLLTLAANAKISVAVSATGKRLIEQIEKAGMNDSFAQQIMTYIAACNGEVKRLNATRKPFTTMITEIQKKFVKVEKDIDPNAAGSPAFRLTALLSDYRKKQIEKDRETEQRLLKNRQAAEKRILGRTDLTDEEKNVALERADNRLLKGQTTLSLAQIETELIPVVTGVEGYIDLLRPWWEEVGRNLPDYDLERIFHPMISFAKKQARKGIRVDSPNVSYLPEPKIKVA